MPQLKTVPPAGRYDGLGVAPNRFAYSFETQLGYPVDGTNSLLRVYSPFTISFVPPDALTLYAQNATQTNLVQSAALANNSTPSRNTQATSLSKVSAVNSQTNPRLASFVSSGRFYSQQRSGFISTLADAYTAADISLQLERMLQAPPLTLLVNPSEMQTQYTKVQSYSQKSRYGYIFEAFSEELPRISFSGSTAGFVSGSNGDSRIPDGYQGAVRLDSAAWQNFMALYQFYRNNGYIFDTVGRSEAHLFIGAVSIEYDQMTYIGHFENFSFSFDATMPNRVEYSMEFVLTRAFDNAKSQTSVGPISIGGQGPSQPNLAASAESRTQLGGQDVASLPFDLIPG